MFCNNEKCDIKNTCFRFLPKHSKSKNLFFKFDNESIGCVNKIEWTYSKEEDEKLKKMKERGNKFYAEHTEHIDKIVSSATMGYSPSNEDVNMPSLWKPEHWLWFIKRRNLN